MKKILLTISLFLIGIVTSYAQQNLGVNQSNPTAKIHITNTENQNSLQVDDEDGDASPFVIDSLGNAQVGGKLTTDSLMIPTNASDGAVLTSDADGNATWNEVNIAVFQEVSNVIVGDAIAGYNVRDINTVKTIIGTSITGNMANNTFTLQPGTYKIVASAPAYAVNEHYLILRNMLDNSILVYGDFNDAISGQLIVTRANINEVIEVSVPITLRLEHFTQTAKNQGLGYNISGENLVYTRITIEKIK
jgi:hypothetical protein